MSFRFVFLISMALLVAGCGLNIGDSQEAPGPVHIARDKIQCMSEIGHKIKGYIEAEIDKDDFGHFMDCVVYSLERFEQYTEGRQAHQYEPEEIRQFLLKYFIKDRPITPEFTKQIMLIKQSVIGGSEHIVTREEFKAFIELIKTIKTETLNLHPYMAVYNFRVADERLRLGQKLPNVNEAIQQLLKTSTRLGDILSKTNKDYSLDNFQQFLVEFRGFLKWDEIFGPSEAPALWGELIKSFKSFAVGGSPESVKPRYWPALLKQSVGWYAVMLQYKYLIKQKDISRDDGLHLFAGAADYIFGLLRDAIRMQPHQVVEFAQLDRMLDAAHAMKLIPDKIRLQSIKGLLRPLLTKVLADQNIPLLERTSEGLTLMNVVQMEEEFNLWAGVQLQLNKNLLTTSTPIKEDTPTINELINPIRMISKSKFVGFAKDLKILPDHVGEMKRLTEHMRPLFQSGEHRVSALYESERLKSRLTHNFHGLTITNALRVGVRFAIRGYAEDVDRSQKMMGLTEDELVKAFNENRALAFDLNLLHPNSKDPGKRSFMEGNLFTYLSDGVNLPSAENPLLHLLTYEEGIELTSFLYSGFTVTRSLYDFMKIQCQLGPDDPFGIPMVEPTCFRNYLKPRLLKNLENLPGMVRYIKELKSDEWIEFEEILMNMVFKPGESRAWIEYTKMALINMLLHYVEAVMTRYDLNEDNRLDEEEGLNAFPTFRGFIDILSRKKMEQEAEKVLRGLSKHPAQKHYVEAVRKKYEEQIKAGHDEATLRYIFLYILSRQEIPNDGNWTRVGIGWSRLFGWGIDLDRMTLTKVFQAIGNASHAQTPASN